MVVGCDTKINQTKINQTKINQTKVNRGRNPTNSDIRSRDSCQAKRRIREEHVEDAAHGVFFP